MAARMPLFATATRGTEPFLVAELNALGVKGVKQDRGGVRFMANTYEAVRLCVHSRVAMRLLYPLGQFEAHGADGLYEAAASIAWEEYLTTRTTFAVEATLKDSEHTHTGFVALKIKDAIVDRMRDKVGSRPDVSSSDPDVRVVAHLAKTSLSVSLDLCGDALFKRGYRVKTTPAPLKETLAAAMLSAAGYTGEEPLCDPMVGSGTLVIEAGLIAARRAPGLGRTFAVERWPTFRDEVKPIFDDVRKEAQAQVRLPPFPLIGRDRDPDALAAAKRNLSEAKLGSAVTLEEADAMTAAAPSGAPGLCLTNPPYGDRLGGGQGQKGIKSFYFKLGEALGGWHGWRLAVLAGNPGFESAFGMKPSKRQELWNGPIECKLLHYPARP